jgi:two-component system aerobic respiration control sensor histidine kinase ArcB
MDQQEEEKQGIPIINRALLVEDYKACQRIMTIFLQQLGYQVDLAADGKTAMQKVNSDAYDLIIEDISLLDGISGKKIIQVTREGKLNVGTPIIVWSAYVNKNDEEKYLAWGGDKVLIKACKITALEKAIQQCFLTPRYEREFHYKLKILQKKWQEIDLTEWVKKNNDLRHPYSILDEAVYTRGEYQSWQDFHAGTEEI